MARFEGGKHRGFGFVTFVSHKGSAFAVKEAGDPPEMMVDGRKCNVRYTEDRGPDLRGVNTNALPARASASSHKAKGAGRVRREQPYRRRLEPGTRCRRRRGDRAGALRRPSPRTSAWSSREALARERAAAERGSRAGRRARKRLDSPYVSLTYVWLRIEKSFCTISGASSPVPQPNARRAEHGDAERNFSIWTRPSGAPTPRRSAPSPRARSVRNPRACLRRRTWQTG